MNLKKAIAAGAAAIVLISSTMSVSAANTPISDYINTLKKNNQENLVLDVDAYKAAYSDLEAVFGDDSDAYIEHYLTIGIYEGRTKGALFNPLFYAKAYDDVRAAFGYDITAIINHYINFGIAENRTQGAANGYTDLASRPQNLTIRQNYFSTVSSGNSSVESSYVNSNAAAGNDGGIISNSASTVNYNSNHNAVGNSASTASSSTVTAGMDYHHTTSIYDDDNSTLLRVEYYDDNNKLTHYSSVSNFDSNSNSYTEDIYYYDEELDTQVHVRTDTYVDGNLSSSENH